MGAIFSTPKVAAAPDPSVAIEAEAEANRITEFTPQGVKRFGTVGATPDEFIPELGGRAVKIEESAFQQSLRETSEDIGLKLGEQLSASNIPLSEFRTAGDIEGGLTPLVTDLEGQGQQLEQATFQRVSDLLTPRFEEQREQTEQRLADQGLPIGSEAFENELNRLEQQQGEQLQGAAFDAVGAGRAEQSRLQLLSQGLRGQQLQEGFGLTALEQQRRAQQFGELGALGGFSTAFQGISVPQINAGALTQNAQLAQFNAQNQASRSQQEMFGAALQAAGTVGAGFASDKRIKDRIIYKGERNELPLYEFSYTGEDERHLGHMAQDVEKVHPEAVGEIEGVKYINYGALDYDTTGFTGKRAF